MTPEDALLIIDKALDTINTTRSNHAMLQQAVDVLRRLINDNMPKVKHFPSMEKAEDEKKNYPKTVETMKPALSDKQIENLKQATNDSGEPT